MPLFDWRENLENLKKDTTSGSRAVCLKAAEIVIKTIDSLPGSGSPDDAADILETISRAAVHVKPAMAGLHNLAATIELELDNARALKHDPAPTVRRAVAEFRSNLLSSDSRIAANALNLIPENACIATISRSGITESVLRLGIEKGRVRRILISESRPAYEGRITAAEYAGLGIPVIFVADAVLPGILEQCHAIIVGGDALCPSGLINKAGTYPVALTARELGKPFIACFGSEKIIPFDIPEHYLREQASNLWADPPEGITVVNRIFEYTPLELLTHVVTENGTVSHDKIPEIFASAKLNPHPPEWF